jgi:hypothetical protein
MDEPKVKLPDVKAAVKKVPPIGWVVIAGVVLAILYLRMKGTGASASAGVGGGGGGGGGGGYGDPLTPGGTGSNPVAAPPIGGQPVPTGTAPGGTTSPLDGLPGAVGYGGNGGGIVLPGNLDPTSAEYRSFFGIPLDIRTVGDLTIPAGADPAGVALAQSQNMSLVDWYKYWITKVQVIVSGGPIIGESQDFLNSPQNNTPLSYLQGTLNGGDIRMYAPGDPRDIAARAQALAELGLTSIPTTFGNTPAASGQGGSPTLNTGATAGAVRAPATPMTLSQFNLANRAGVISRATTAGLDPTTSSVNATIASNYQKYLSGL